MNLNISTKQGYDIATGLCSSGIEQLSNLKWLITARLRALAGVECFYCMVRESTEIANSTDMQRELAWLRNTAGQQPVIKEVVHHWLGHAYMASIHFDDKWLTQFISALTRAMSIPTAINWGAVYSLLKEVENV